MPNYLCQEEHCKHSALPFFASEREGLPFCPHCGSENVVQTSSEGAPDRVEEGGINTEHRGGGMDPTGSSGVKVASIERSSAGRTPIVGICGASGSGKTTALVLLFGVIRGLLKGGKIGGSPDSKAEHHSEELTPSGRLKVRRREKRPFSSWRFLEVWWKDTHGLDRWIEEIENIKRGLFPMKTDPGADLAGENWFRWVIQNHVFGLSERYDIRSTDLAGESFLRAIRPGADAKRRKIIEHLFESWILFFFFQPHSALKWTAEELAGYINFFSELRKRHVNKGGIFSPKPTIFFVATQSDRQENRDILAKYIEGSVGPDQWQETLKIHGPKLVERFIEDEMEYVFKEVEDCMGCNYTAISVGEVETVDSVGDRILSFDLDSIPRFFLETLRSPRFRLLEFARKNLLLVLAATVFFLLVFFIILASVS